MIKHVQIENFKSLESVSVDLAPVTILIGRSGAGKSNFVEALRWLREYLTHRNEESLRKWDRGWNRVMSATAQQPMTVGFRLHFDAPGFTRDFDYDLRFHQPRPDAIPQFAEERLCLGDQVLFHQRGGKWVQPPNLVSPPQPGEVMLGGLTGIQEATIAHLVLTSGIGCYAFPDDVLTQPMPSAKSDGTGLSDTGDNFLSTFVTLNVNLQTWHHLRDMAASLRRLKPHLKAIDLQQPQRGQIVVTHDAGGRLLVFDVAQESEGFRRLLACLLALYQTPPKQTVIFDEPEKGIYPAGLVILAEEFKGYAEKGRGQVLLTTHSPAFLDQFPPESIRVVEMIDHVTRIGPISTEQMGALRDHFLRPGDLLTTDEARLEGTLVGAD